VVEITISGFLKFISLVFFILFIIRYAASIKSTGVCSTLHIIDRMDEEENYTRFQYSLLFFLRNETKAASEEIKIKAAADVVLKAEALRKVWKLRNRTAVPVRDPMLPAPAYLTVAKKRSIEKRGIILFVSSIALRL